MAVPAIGRDLNAGLVALQWTVTSYLVTTAALLLLAGALADRLGRKRVLVVGLLVMLVSSILCSIAPSVETLIAARLVQGVGGALVTPPASRSSTGRCASLIARAASGSGQHQDYVRTSSAECESACNVRRYSTAASLRK